MKNKFFQFKSFVTYWLDAVDEHSLHSPFFFHFYTKVLKSDLDDLKLDPIEDLRKRLLADDRSIEVIDLGVGSTHLKSSTRRISDIARTSLSARKYSLVYRKIIDLFNFKNVLELGTSLGINTLYLASCKECRVSTFEGSNTIAETAQALFDTACTNNIKIIRGNIDQTLPVFLQSIERIDLAFVDAHHRYAPTLKYFSGLIQKIHTHSIVVLDDIHYSEEMEKAWKEIQKHDRVCATADLYRCGIVFFDPSLNKQHVVLQF